MNPLQNAKNRLVRRWGEMGGYWGINRTMAELHALLFVTREPLCTDDVMDQLKISRGNASMNLRALVDWGLIERIHKLGDRKEYFKADTEVWHMFETIMRERRRREVEPIIATLRRCCDEVENAGHELDDVSPDDSAEFRRRVQEFAEFLTTMGKLFDLMLLYGEGGMKQFASLLESVPKPKGAARRTAALGT